MRGRWRWIRQPEMKENAMSEPRKTEYNHPPMGRVVKGLTWLACICICILIWVHGIIPAICAFGDWLAAL